MDFTINCTRVPIPQGTTLYGIPVGPGPAPETLGSASDHGVIPYDSNDGTALNPTGRAVLDRKEPVPTSPLSKYAFNHRTNTIISSLNTRTLGPNGRLEELANNALTQNIDVLALQEHRFYHSDSNIKYRQIESFMLLTSSATKNSANASTGGIGFLLSLRAYNNLVSAESISPRILIIELLGNPRTTIICAYSPHNSSPLDEVENFYSILRQTVDQVPPHNFLVIAGDFNAKLGPEDVKFTYNSATNRNGELLKDFMDEFNIFSAGNNFMKPKGQLWTFEYPTGERCQIDYLLFRKKWRNSVKDSRSYSSFSTVRSDHRIISAHVKLSLRKSKKSISHPMKSIDWKQVSANPPLSQQFTIEVFNRYQALEMEDINTDNIDIAYDNLIKLTEEVALSTLPKRKSRSKVTPGNSNIVKQAQESLRNISQKYNAAPTQSHKIELITAKKKLDDAYLNSQVDYINGKINTLSKHHISHQHQQAWSTIKELAGKTASTNIRIKGGSGKKRLENWTDHFKSLLGKKSVLPENSSLPSVKISDPLDIDTSPFTKAELKTAADQLKPSKAFGSDNIPAIIWKNESFHNLLLSFCNQAFSNQKPPKVWQKSNIIPVPKKGDLSMATNYRGISLMPIAAKVYNRMILNRLVPFVNPLLRKNQNGFRKGRSTLSQILSLRRIIEESKACNKDLAFVFVDFSKAFDSVDREEMFKILELYGIPPKIITAIKLLYTDTSSTIVTSDGETPPIPILAGILQGDTLAPFLFIIVVDYILRMSIDRISSCGYELQPRKSSRFPAKYITDTDFADDIALISHSLENAQSLLQSLEQASNCVGLYLNESKTQYMNLCTETNTDKIKTLNEVELKEVDDYKYLGSFISSSLKDFDIRKALAWSACNDMHNIWTSEIGTNLKVNIFKVAIEPILLYGSETWTLTKAMEKRLDGTYTRLLMRAQNLSWKNHPSKEQIYGKLPAVSELIKARRVQFAGHCYRAENEVISSLLLWSPTAHGRGRKLSYPAMIARATNLEKQDLSRAMQDLKYSRSRVNSIVSTVVAQMMMMMIMN